MKATLSDYLESRRFNRKLFGKVKQSIERLEFDATAKISMSAKYQTPIVHVQGPQSGVAADEIYSILSEYFQTSDPIFVSEDRTDIEFRDMY